VTCGSMIKLRHLATSFRLHSHQVAYGSGSGQQSVTGSPSGTPPARDFFHLYVRRDDGRTRSSQGTRR
jgi:hypothetical protein